jgi:hypothetical protein
MHFHSEMVDFDSEQGLRDFSRFAGLPVRSIPIGGWKPQE